MKKISLLIFSVFCSLIIIAQNNKTITQTQPSKIEENQKTSNSAPKTRAIWTNPNIKNNVFSVTIPNGFTCFGFAWETNDLIKPNEVVIKYRLFNQDGWTTYMETEGYISPNETPTHLFWTDLNFTTSQVGSKSIEFEVTSNSVPGVIISKLVLDLYKIENEIMNFKPDYGNSKACPHRPYVIPSSVWLDPYYTQPPYTSTIISPTHTVIHHGASPDTYTNGAAVVRSYWNYHVNSNGWSDIGYNYLFDKYGNAYQGRQNSSPLTQDVNGAHAGASNPYSLGINFLGNADVTLPTTIQLDTVMQFLAWWYDWRNYDPTTSATLILQSGGSASVPRILGHKDTNIGGTSCPGNTLYAGLASIRTGTKAIIDACSGTAGPTNLVANALGCPDNNVQFNWLNSGTGWYIQVSTSATFTNPFIKWVSGLTTYTGPAGFVLESDGVSPLVFVPYTTYYWRIWNGTTFTNGASFTILSCDNVAPTSTIASPNTWKTSDFTATFTDVDNETVEKAFYQVLDFDGTNWGANSTKGFFADNFDQLLPSWTNYAGTWTVNSGELIQSDAANGNTNIYASLDQTLSNRYLYQFVASAGTTGSTRRFGFHFFSDNAALANRGNSYFIWFRVDDQSLQFYKVENDVFTLMSTVTNVITNPGQLYDYKVTYDRTTGRIAVWRDNSYLGDWIDTSPYFSNGNYISFRTGNCSINVSEIKVFRSRYPTVTVTLNDNTKDIRFQNPNSSTFGAKIKSIIVDANNNLSAIAYHDLNVDWTPPTDVVIIDGNSVDIDTVYTTTTASAEWTTSSDPNSDVSEYWYALGSSQGATDIVGWTNNGTNTSVSLNSLNLMLGSHYYFSVKVKNNADLWSNVNSSDGFIVSSLTLPVADFYVYEDTLYLPNANALFFNTSLNAASYFWDFGDGSTSVATNPWHNYTLAGVYNVTLVAIGSGLPNDTLIRNNYVYVLNGNAISSTGISAVKVYPNPFENELKIDFPVPYTGNIFLYDGVGRKVWESQIENKTSYTFPYGVELEKGYYVLKIISKDSKEMNFSLIRK